MKNRAQIKVKVYLAPYLEPVIKEAVLDIDAMVTLKQGDTVGDLLIRLGIPFLMRPFMAVAVNHTMARKNTILAEGDTVSFLTFSGGG